MESFIRCKGRQLGFLLENKRYENNHYNKRKGVDLFMSIAVIYGGTRTNGNSEELTKYTIQGLEVESIFLTDYTIQPIVDGRHATEGYIA